MRLMDNTLDRLIEEQNKRGLTNAQMAELLGYNQDVNWVRIKTGRSPFNDKFYMKAPARLPRSYSLRNRRPPGPATWRLLKKLSPR